MNDFAPCEDYALPTEVCGPYTPIFFDKNGRCHRAGISHVTPSDATRVTYKDKLLTIAKIDLAEADALIHYLLFEEQPDAHYRVLLSSWMLKSLDRFATYPKGK